MSDSSNKRKATCHPNKPHVAKGLCGSCYGKQWWKSHPEHTKGYHLKRRSSKIRYAGARDTCTYCFAPLVRPKRLFCGQYCRIKWSDADAKLKAFLALGGKCTHCENADLRVMQIDHIHGDGSKDALRGKCRELYKHIAKVGSNNIYQLLCANCHIIKHLPQYQLVAFRREALAQVSSAPVDNMQHTQSIGKDLLDWLAPRTPEVLLAQLGANSELFDSCS